jgi:hypothetical protein
MLDEQTIADLKSKHGEALAYVEGTAGVLVFRKATRDEYERYQDKYAGDSTGLRKHLKELALATLVHPKGGEALNACMDAEPALLLDEVAPLMHELAGVGRERQRGKL